MTALLKADEFFTVEEYLELERAAEHKSDYLNGDIVAMAGATFRHNVIAANLLRIVGNGLVDRPCMALSSDMKVRIEKANCFRYPDLSGVCGPIDFFDNHQDIYCNPALLAEILSPSTEKYDRTDKFALYRLIDTFCEYLLIAQDRCEVEVHRKQENGKWSFEKLSSMEDRVSLGSLKVEFSMSDLYAKVEFP